MNILVRLKSLLQDRYIMVYDAEVTATSIRGMRSVYLFSNTVLINTAIPEHNVAEFWVMTDCKFPEMTEEDEREKEATE